MPLDDKKVLEAIKKVKQNSKKRKFVQSIELAINMKDVDLKKTGESCKYRANSPE